jgi:hypothetical protein
MFRNGWTGDGENAGDLSGWLSASTQEIEDGTAGGIGESLERCFR